MNREAIARQLQEQREALWDVMASLEVVSEALLERFGNWPEGIPDYHRVLGNAALTIDRVTGELEPDVILGELSKARVGHFLRKAIAETVAALGAAEDGSDDKRRCDKVLCNLESALEEAEPSAEDPAVRP